MKKSEEITWKEIYEDCKYLSLNPFKLSNPVEIEKVYVRSYSKNYYIEGYDWDTKDKIKHKIEVLDRSPAEFFVFCDAVNKGTLSTIKLLNSAKSEEERVAIWLYAFTNELLNCMISNDSRRYIEDVWFEARSFLQDKVDCFWHHKMTKLVPDIYFSNLMLDGMNFTSHRPVIELALINAYFINQDYKAVYYIINNK